ncbi:helix-turn-helix transcriptional regulator [Bifidobacterium avesanii]|uniref:Helix-turn-helix domain-containing protein n=1 Tax=Bifidobacterium avesanii TaxID=1798157 RepID=A0A7K3THS2_9BIFI|nr:helix-turn-helix transcriptional regulator [Bifidobacterium avesanii]KAB8293619.1 transcriptional regulator [Bifidobacterium avesanii]NEG78244.1 helix-turn-helix domain-containing protein [Bifidobacterium avesanii]
MGLKELRKATGLTQVQLAKRAGMSQTEISAYETGRRDVGNMTLTTALRLSRILNCHPSDLTDGYPD